MAKQLSMVDAFTPMPPCITDWNLCVIFQKDTKTGLPKPKHLYKSLDDVLIHFQMHGRILDIDIFKIALKIQ